MLKFIVEYFLPGLDDDIEPDCDMFVGPFHTFGEAQRYAKNITAPAENPRIHALNDPR